MSLEAYYSRPHHDRVAIIAVNIVHPAGNNLAEYWQNVLAGNICIGVKKLTLGDKTMSYYAGEVSGFDISPFMGGKQAKKADRFAQYAVGAGIPALLEAGVLSYKVYPDNLKEAEYNLLKVDPDRAGVEMGIAAGGVEAVEKAAELIIRRGRATPRTIPHLNPAKEATELGRLAGFTGRQVTHNTACTSSIIAFEEASDRLKLGKADLIVAGGAESLRVAVAFDGFSSMGVLAEYDPENLVNPSRPLLRSRMGLVIGEGAALGVLTRLDFALKNNLPVIAELASVFSFSDPRDELKPTPANVEKLLRTTIELAGLETTDIAGISTHTAGTEGDVEEIAGAKLVFGDHSPNVTVRPSKLNGGHLMGPIGAVGVVDCVQAIRTSLMPPMPFLKKEFIDSLGFDFPTEIREKEFNAVVGSALGLDGQYAGVVVVKARP